MTFFAAFLIPRVLIRGTLSIVLIAGMLSLAVPQSGVAEDAASPSAESVSELLTHIAAGRIEAATELGRSLEEQGSAGGNLTFAFARLARSLQQSGDLEQASEFYQRSVRVSALPANPPLAAGQLNLVRLAAASTLIQVGKLPAATEAVAMVLDPQAPTDESQTALAVKFCLRIGATAFAKSDHKTAAAAYQLATTHASGDQESTAMLGHAWALALQGDQPTDAAKKLAAFIEAYPDHPDAPRAARASATCLNQAGREADARAVLTDLLVRWPASEAAFQVVNSQPTGKGVDEWAAPIQDWLASDVAIENLDKLDAKTLPHGLWVVAQRDDIEGWSRYASMLAQKDATGQASADALQRFTDKELHAEAERLAALLISPPEDAPVAAASREAACRWAGRTMRWSMLALASESESPETASESRSLSTERLFAEALMQTGRPADAHVWWCHLVDHREAADFATLLRCAETETAIGKDSKLAAKRLDAAGNAAGDDPFRRTLVDLLRAELSIRKMDFEAARGHLEKIVRVRETDGGLRGRAQWLIGETYFLQRKYAEAIEAYRRVEGIDSSGVWVAAALVQAGKSFEQLGRTRDAAVCYLGLVDRFGESPYAGTARRRLAAISPDSPSLPDPSNPTLRR